MRFEAPETVEAAVALLAGEAGTAYPLSGGTDLLVQMRSGRVAPDLVVDTKRIATLREIAREGGGWRIGAAVSGAEINEQAALVAEWPGLAEAANLVGSTQVAGRATLAGNLCTASPAADTVPAMAAAGALARIVGPAGRRDIPVEQIPVGVQKNALAKGEMIECILLPERGARAADCYLRFIPRTEMDIAVVGCAVSLSLDESGVVEAAKVALGAVAPTVVVVEDAAAALIGTALEDAALDALAAACEAACNPIDDKRGTVAFRIEVAGTLARRAAQIAYTRAKDRP